MADEPPSDEPLADEPPSDESVRGEPAAEDPTEDPDLRRLLEERPPHHDRC